MAMVESTLGEHVVTSVECRLRLIQGWIKFWFPEFEFTWLAGEMREVRQSCTFVSVSLIPYSEPS